jgi:hypothetical protein
VNFVTQAAVLDGFASIRQPLGRIGLYAPTLTVEHHNDKCESSHTTVREEGDCAKGRASFSIDLTSSRSSPEFA